MYEELKKVTANVSKSLVTIVSVTEKEDVLFGTTVEMENQTTGLIIHNNSVELLILVSLDRIKDADHIKLKISDTAMVNAEIQNYEKDLNLAVLAVALEDVPVTYISGLKVAVLGESYSLDVGTPVIALGSPNGYVGSVDIGVISSRFSSVYITDNKLDLFNTNITDNENSDGVIVNLKGEVIGIITHTLKKDLNKDLSTAIGISKLKIILKNLVNKEPRIYFGVITEDMTDAAKREHEVSSGVYVNEVIEDSPAFQAGIQAGDIIYQIDDRDIGNTYDLNSAISSYAPDEQAIVRMKRTTGTSEREIEYTVTLQKERIDSLIQVYV